MAIRTHTSKKGVTTYKVTFRHAGRQTSETFPTAEAAADFDALVKRLGSAAALRVLEHRQGYVDDAVLTVAEQLTAHIASLSHLEDGTLNNYLAIQRAIAAQPLGTLPIDAVTRTDVAGWLRSMQAAGRSASTIRNHQALLSSALQQAVHDGAIPTNPAHKHKIRRTQRKRRHFLTYDEFGRLRDAANPHYRPLLEFMVGTGMRLGEVTALRPMDFHLDAQPDPTVTVVRAWKRGGGYGPPKTERGERTLSLAGQTVRAIAHLFVDRQPDELLFVNLRGERIQQSTLYESWKGWRKKAGLPDTVRIHDLRHSHAAWMLAQGMSLYDLQHRLGHESINTTADTYGGLMPESAAVAARSAGLALAQVPAAKQITSGPQKHV